jgi:hypothetical protein
MGEINRAHERMMRNTKKQYIAMRDMIQRRIDESKRDKVRFEKAKHRADTTTEDGKIDDGQLSKMISTIGGYITEDEDAVDKYAKKIEEIEKAMRATGG